MKGEARLEYYEDKNKLDKPHRILPLKEVFHVSIKQPSKQEQAFSLHTNDEIFRVSCQSHEEMRRWVMDIITTKPHGADIKEIQQLGHVMAWRVTVLAKGMSPIFRFQRNTFIFVLDEFTFSLINPDNHSDYWQWLIKHIRNCGNENNCFTFESGRKSFTGQGRMWLQMSSSKVASEAHHIVLEQMRKCVPDPETEAKLTERLAIQEKHLDTVGGRQRGLSAPTEPARSTSPPYASGSQSVGAHQSSSTQINPPHRRQLMPLPSPAEYTDDPVSYVEMHPPRQSATQVSRFSRQKSLPGYASNSLEHACQLSNSTGTVIKHSQSAYPIKQPQHTTHAATPDTPNYTSGPDIWQGTTAQPPRSNVFLERRTEVIEYPEDDPQDRYLFPQQSNSPSVSPSTPGSYSISPQLNSIEGMVSPPEKTLSPHEIIRQQRIRNHAYDEIADSGVSGVASQGYSIEDQLENMSLQGSQSYKMLLDRFSPQHSSHREMHSLQREMHSLQREMHPTNTQPIRVNASHEDRERCRIMSPVTDSRKTASGYEVMQLQKSGIPSQKRTYVNHPANWVAPTEYDVPRTSSNTTVQ